MTLRGHHALASIDGTALPLETDAGTSIKGYQRLGLECGFVNGAKSEVADLLRLARVQTAAAADVTGIGGRTGIQMEWQDSHAGVADCRGGAQSLAGDRRVPQPPTAES